MHDWLTACKTTSRGLLFLDNLGIDLETSALSGAELAEFAGAIENYRSDPSERAVAGEEPYRRAAEAVIANHLLYLRGPEADPALAGFTTVARLDRFVAQIWFDFSWMGMLGDDVRAEDILQVLDSVDDWADILQPDAALRTGVPMVWLTQLSELDGVAPVSPQASLADVVRDRLGLPFLDDCLLCRIDLQPSDLDRRHIRRPTAFDGRFNLVFRSNIANEARGLALDMRTGKQTATEVVHPPVKLGGHHRFVSLGRVSYTPAFSWEQLAKSVEPTRVDTVLSCLTQGVPHVQ